MKTDEEQELRNAASYLRRQSHSTGNLAQYDCATVAIISWASMLERAADRIQELEAHLERFVA